MCTRTILDYFKPTKNNSNTQENTLTLSFDAPHKRTCYYIFTDGSQIRQPKTYKSISVSWAYVIKLFNGTVIHSDSGKISSNDTNQRAELLAIYNSLTWCHQNIPNQENMQLFLYTDSEYAVKCFTLWIYSWKQSNWKNSKKQNVKHRDIIEPSFELIKRYKVSINHIKSHTGKSDFFSVGNSDADKLATSITRRTK